MVASLSETTRSGIQTAEVTGSISVAPTSTNTFPESSSGMVCQKIYQKITEGLPGNCCRCSAIHGLCEDRPPCTALGQEGCWIG